MMTRRQQNKPAEGRAKKLARAVVFGAALGFTAPALCRADGNVEEGKRLYEKHCAQCHGMQGDAKAPSASRFQPAPRDFTTGKYKVRHTPTGALPTDDDIANAIKKGLAFNPGVGAYTGMPPWHRFTSTQVNDIVAYLKTFSPDFADPNYNNPNVIKIPNPPGSSEESVARGRKVFENNECIKCHGQLGRADGPSAPTLKDDWGNYIRAADLTMRWTFRGGGSKEDVFRTISTGFNGTPMPSYGDTLSEDDRWDLINYIFSLSKRDAPGYNKPDQPIIAAPVESAIELGDMAAARALFEKAEPAYIPIVGQVVEPGRKFYPAATELTVRAIFNKDELALLLTWHDMRAETKGTNAPDAAVTEEEPTAAAQEEPASADPFAEEEVAEVDPFAEEEAAAAGPADKLSDAVAVQLPAKQPEGFQLPYFIFGDGKNPVDLWFFDLAKDAPQLYTGKGSRSLAPRQESAVSALKHYENGEWAVIFKRPRTLEAAIPLEERTMVPIAFSIWDGFSEDTGNRRGLTTWYTLYLPPTEKESALGPMLAYGGGLLLVELAFIGLVRRKSRRA